MLSYVAFHHEKAVCTVLYGFEYIINNMYTYKIVSYVEYAKIIFKKFSTKGGVVWVFRTNWTV